MPMRRSRLFLAALLCAPALISAPALSQEQPAPPRYGDVTAQTAPVADAYFEAYIARDWDRLEPLLADDASFQDPTATHVFGGILSQGRDAMMERFRTGYSSIRHMSFSPTRRFVSGNVALFEGALDWGVDLGDGTVVDSVTPMVIVLSIEAGKVVAHRDYVDYAPFLAAVRAMRARES